MTEIFDEYLHLAAETKGYNGFGVTIDENGFCLKTKTNKNVLDEVILDIVF